MARQNDFVARMQPLLNVTQKCLHCVVDSTKKPAKSMIMATRARCRHLDQFPLDQFNPIEMTVAFAF